MGLLEDIGDGPVGLDTALFIYWMEDNPRYAPVLEPLFGAIDSGRLQATTSALTLLETLVVPLREGDLVLAERYEAALTQSRGLQCLDIDRDVLRAAAQLRAATRMRTPDAIQLATCLAAGCSAFVTNDRRLRSLPSLRVLELDSYL